jgi:hypothetical protein
MVQVRWLSGRRPATARDGQISPEKRKVGSSTLPLTTICQPGWQPASPAFSLLRGCFRLYLAGVPRNAALCRRVRGELVGAARPRGRTRGCCPARRCLRLAVRPSGAFVHLERGDGALGSTSERFDFGVLMSPVQLADRHTWITSLSRSTWSQESLRSSPGRRPSMIDSTNSASSLRLASALASRPSSARQKRQVVWHRSVSISVTGAFRRVQPVRGACEQSAGRAALNIP